MFLPLLFVPFPSGNQRNQQKTSTDDGNRPIGAIGDRTDEPTDEGRTSPLADIYEDHKQICLLGYGPMKRANLKITLHSAKGLKDVKHIGVMNPYAECWISGDVSELKRKTNVAKKGDSDPVWECPMDFENVSMNKDNKLCIEVKHGGKMWDRNIGVVEVSFKDLLDEGKSGDRGSYWLTTSDEKQGQITLSYIFSDVEKPDEDGVNTTTTQEPVAPVQRKRDKVKKVVKRVGEKMFMCALRWLLQLSSTRRSMMKRMRWQNEYESIRCVCINGCGIEVAMFKVHKPNPIYGFSSLYMFMDAVVVVVLLLLSFPVL